MKNIYLDGEKQLRIFSLPLRQKILREMNMAGMALTAKQIADRLKITPSSAQHHLLKLESIGLVEQDHLESINGIKARFMRASDVVVSIGQQIADETTLSRDALMKSHLLEAYQGYQNVIEHARNNPQDRIGRGNDIVTEIVHLTDEQAQELRAMVMEYTQKHKNSVKGTKPWQIVYLAYDMNLAESGSEV
ncbi:MAG: helix-turn-helix domain-containing protein [Saccharofermentanales bacterium]